MRFLIFFIFSLLLVLGAGCSGSDEESSGGDATSLSETGEFSSDSGISGEIQEKVVPVTLSLADQEKAKLAPEGMVFIKGGCLAFS